MFNALEYADALAGALTSLRAAPVGGEAQQASLQALVDMTEHKSAAVRCYDGALTVDQWSVPVVGPDVATLIAQFTTHGIQEIIIGQGAEAPEVLAMLRGLAAAPGQARLKERLRDADSTRVMIILRRAPEGAGPRRRTTVAEAFERADVDDRAKDEWNRFLRSSAEQAQPRVVDVWDTAGAERPTAWPEQAVPLTPDDLARAGLVPSFETSDTPPPRPGRATATGRDPARASRPSGELDAPLAIGDPGLADALASVQADPYGEGALQRVTQLGKLIEVAAREERLRDAMRSLEAFIALEQAAPDADTRASYSVVLDRTLKRDILAVLVPSLTDPRLAGVASVVIRRGRDVAADMLVGVLASTDSLTERRACLATLRAIPKGVDRALRLLRDPRWQVVRNVAEAVGDLRLDAATPYLSALERHEDARVRRAAIVALARIGSAATIEPLRHAVAEGTPEMRGLIAVSISGAQAGALVGPIRHWMEQESKPETITEYCRALGRIGTTEAVEVLEKAAGTRGLFASRKTQATRLAAITGLTLAGPAARTALERLAAEADREVRDAATRALAE